MPSTTRRIPSLVLPLSTVLLLSLVPATAAAQHAAEVGPRAIHPPAPQHASPSTFRLAAGGIAGGATGLFGLGFLGAWLADESAEPNDDIAAVGGFLLGAAVGEVAGVAAGVHLADGGRGSFWNDLGVSALVAGGTLAALAAVDDDGASAWALAGAGVALQVGLTVRTQIGSR